MTDQNARFYLKYNWIFHSRSDDYWVALTKCFVLCISQQRSAIFCNKRQWFSYIIISMPCCTSCISLDLICRMSPTSLSIQLPVHAFRLQKLYFCQNCVGQQTFFQQATIELHFLSLPVGQLSNTISIFKLTCYITKSRSNIKSTRSIANYFGVCRNGFRSIFQS